MATLYDNRIRSPEAEPFHRQAIAAYVGYRKANGTRHRYFEAAVNAYRACLEKCGNSEVQIEAKISEATA